MNHTSQPGNGQKGIGAFMHVGIGGQLFNYPNHKAGGASVGGTPNINNNKGSSS